MISQNTACNNTKYFIHLSFFDNFTGMNKFATKTQRTNSFETKFAMVNHKIREKRLLTY